MRCVAGRIPGRPVPCLALFPPFADTKFIVLSGQHLTAAMTRLVEELTLHHVPPPKSLTTVLATILAWGPPHPHPAGCGSRWNVVRGRTPPSPFRVARWV